MGGMMERVIVVMLTSEVDNRAGQQYKPATARSTRNAMHDSNYAAGSELQMHA